jgi:hypothetical protein
VDGETYAAGAGATAFLPRRLPHAFAVTSAQARFLTLHTPAGFEDFARATGAVATDAPPPDEPLDRATLTAIARSYGIEFLGPPPAL